MIHSPQEETRIRVSSCSDAEWWATAHVVSVAYADSISAEEKWCPGLRAGSVALAIVLAHGVKNPCK
jgi:hypothetical protein